jgi:hypothetical protein
MSKSKSKLYYDRRSVGCQAPIWDLRPISLLRSIIFRQLRISWCGAPSLTRSRVCSFQLLLGITSAASLMSESDRTHEHILLSLFLRLPQPGRPGSCTYFYEEHGSPVIPPATGLFGFMKLKLKLIYDRRSVGKSLLVSSSHLKPVTRFFVFHPTVAGFLIWAALPDQRIGLNLTHTIASGPCQSSHSRVQVPQNSWPYFTVSHETPQPWRPGPRIYIPQE